MNDEKYVIGSGSFRLLIGDLYELYCYHFSLTRRLAEAADEKALLKIQKSVSGYERRMKRLCRRWGLVGPSGSGKSTITKLITGFWEATSGTISLGGVDLKNIPLSQLSSYVSYVSQDNYLFDESIRENIRMGRLSATDQEVEDVARKCGCHDFIMDLEHGYDTIVGGAGGHLSGGERQRIAIARAMLKDAPIIIFDEATAYLDPENESLIQEAISKLVQGKTLIMVAHRLYTVTGADQLVVVNQGRIEAIGTHEELLKKCPLYKEMWQAHIGSRDEGGATA